MKRVRFLRDHPLLIIPAMIVLPYWLLIMYLITVREILEVQKLTMQAVKYTGSRL